jgi:hypothetical protein
MMTKEKKVENRTEAIIELADMAATNWANVARGTRVVVNSLTSWGPFHVKWRSHSPKYNSNSMYMK